MLILFSENLANVWECLFFLFFFVLSYSLLSHSLAGPRVSTLEFDEFCIVRYLIFEHEGALRASEIHNM